MKKKKSAPKPAPKGLLKEIFENAKVRVLEITMKPGSESDAMELPARVTRAIKGGTLTRTYPGGKKEKVSFKSGEVRFGEPVPAAVVKNTGKSTIVLYSVFLK